MFKPRRTSWLNPASEHLFDAGYRDLDYTYDPPRQDYEPGRLMRLSKKRKGEVIGAVNQRFQPVPQKTFTITSDETNGVFHRHICDYDSVSGVFIWLNRDPIGEKGSINLYLFCFDNALDIIDLFGLDTYKCNRKLGGGPPLPPLDPLSHTFTFTTGANGAVNNTYSWGNSANTHGWNYNQPEDMSAASEALGNGDATKIGNSSFDPFVNQAFNDLNKPENEHANWGVCNNCKSEANNLANLAHSLQNAAQNPPASLLNPPYDTGNVNAPPSSASSPSTCN